MPYNDNRETTPLISESENRPVYRARPLRKPQIVSLLLAYFAQAVVQTLALPFLAQLIGNLDVVRGNKDRVGYYMGILESVGHFTTAIAVLQWGYYSDHAGRKKVLLAGLLGLAVAITCFGLSRTYLSLVISRFIMGAFNAVKPTVKSTAAESCGGDESQMAFFFSLMPIVYTAGAAVGPFFGGVLAKPSERFPSYFRAQLWLHYPYLLPCLGAAVICIISFGFTLVIFTETLPSLQSAKTHGCQSYNASNNTSSTLSSPFHPSETIDGSPKPDSLLPIETNIRTRHFILVLANYAIFTLLAISFDVVFALLLGSPISAGGLSLPPRTIGTIFSVGSIVSGLFQALFFTRMHRLWGLRNIYMVTMIAYLPIYTAMPIMAAVAKFSGQVNPLIWTILGFVRAACVLTPGAFTCMYIYITKASPHPSALGRTHAAAQTIYSLMGAIGPASATALVAASVQYNLLGGTLAYVVLVALSAVGVGLAWLLPDVEPHLTD